MRSSRRSGEGVCGKGVCCTGSRCSRTAFRGDWRGVSCAGALRSLGSPRSPSRSATSGVAVKAVSNPGSSAARVTRGRFMAGSLCSLLDEVSEKAGAGRVGMNDENHKFWARPRAVGSIDVNHGISNPGPRASAVAEWSVRARKLRDGHVCQNAVGPRDRGLSATPAPGPPVNRSGGYAFNSGTNHELRRCEQPCCWACW